MRIISGKFRGYNLYTLSGNRTRPTMGYTRESMFSAIHDCEGLTVLDLFSGSGAIAFEAISRGAKSATLVEFSAKAISVIKKNIEKLECTNQINIKRKMVDSFLKKCEDKFDLIFLDPPYDKNLVNETIKQIIESKVAKKGTKILIEHSKFEDLACEFDEMCLYSRKYRNSQLSILIYNNEENNEDI